METKENPAQILHSPWQIALAALIGAPLAGCWFLACNCRALGRQKAAALWLAGGAIGSVATYIPVPSPDDLLIRALAIPLAYSACLGAAAWYAHGGAIARHIAEGGRMGSWWAVVGISILVHIIVGLVLFVVVFPLLILTGYYHGP